MILRWLEKLDGQMVGAWLEVLDRMLPSSNKLQFWKGFQESNLITKVKQMVSAADILIHGIKRVESENDSFGSKGKTPWKFSMGVYILFKNNLR